MNASPLKILIVDDEVELAELIAFDLNSCGYDCECASGGDAAFELILKNKYHVVISDIRMPKGDGFKLLQNIKLSFPELPVILITGFTDVNENIAKSMGAIAVLKKPDALSKISKLIAALDLK